MIIYLFLDAHTMFYEGHSKLFERFQVNEQVRP